MTYPRVSHLSDNRQIASAINQALKLGESAGTGGGTGTVTTTGTPASGNLAKFSGSTSITNADLTGDVTTSGALATTIASGAVTLAKMANMATASLIYRKTAGSGAPEVNSLATLKTDLGLTGTNSGDQTITLTGDVTGSGTGSFATTARNRCGHDRTSAAQRHLDKQKLDHAKEWGRFGHCGHCGQHGNLCRNLLRDRGGANGNGVQARCGDGRDEQHSRPLQRL
jgi:hypothetical protein